MTLPTNRQTVASLIEQDCLEGNWQQTLMKKRYHMKSRWQKSLEAAVEAYDTPMPWERGEKREAMIARREAKIKVVRLPRNSEPRRA